MPKNPPKDQSKSEQHYITIAPRNPKGKYQVARKSVAGLYYVIAECPTQELAGSIMTALAADRPVGVAELPNGKLAA